MKKPTREVIENLVSHDPYVSHFFYSATNAGMNYEEMLIITVDALVKVKNEYFAQLEKILLNSTSPCGLTSAAPDPATPSESKTS